MATLLSLPPELIAEICFYLDDEDDLLALRMTSRHLNPKAREIHLDSLYNCRSIFFAPVSLENILKVSKHPSGANLRVRELKIYACTPYVFIPDSERNLKSLKRHFAKDVEFVEEIAKALTHMHYDSEKEFEDILRIAKFHEESVILAQAFMGLPNIRKITFLWGQLEAARLSRSEFNLLFPSAGMVAGKRIPEDLYYGHTDYLHYLDYGNRDIWSITLNSAWRSGLRNIEELCKTDTGDGGAPESWFVMSPRTSSNHRDMLSKLRVLNVELRQDADYIDDFPEMAKANSAFYHWIEEVGSSLEHLVVNRRTFPRQSYYYYDEQDVFIQTQIIPNTLELPKLKYLKLIGVNVSADNLVSLVRGFEIPLKGLHLIDCRVEDPIVEWFHIIQMLSRRKWHELVLRLHSSQYSYKLPLFTIKGSTATAVYGVDSHDTISTAMDTEDIDDFDNADEFWNFVSDGSWKSDKGDPPPDSFDEMSESEDERPLNIFPPDDSESDDPVEQDPYSPDSEHRKSSENESQSE